MDDNNELEGESFYMEVLEKLNRQVACGMQQIILFGGINLSGSTFNIYTGGEPARKKKLLGEDERIGQACTQIFKDGLINSKHDFAAVHQIIIEKIRESITYESLASIIAKYANLPAEKKPNAHDLNGESFKGNFPDWNVVDASPAKTKHFTDVAKGFLSAYSNL